MRTVKYFEDMVTRADGKKLSNAQLVAFWSYNRAKDYDLDYPVLEDTVDCDMRDVVKEFENCRIGKFYYAQASTGLKDVMGELFFAGYKVVGVIDKKDAPDFCWFVSGKYILLFGKR